MASIQIVDRESQNVFFNLTNVIITLKSIDKNNTNLKKIIVHSETHTPLNDFIEKLTIAVDVNIDDSTITGDLRYVLKQQIDENHFFYVFTIV